MFDYSVVHTRVHDLRHLRQTKQQKWLKKVLIVNYLIQTKLLEYTNSLTS